MNEYKDWIVRFYASHKDIPKGHSDCETLKELVRCKDCDRNPYNKPADVDVVHGTPERCWDLASRKNAFCSEAERAEE